MRKKPELLAPAGDMERLRYALLYGADAVYLAGTRFGMRGAPQNFGEEELRQAIALCHAQQKRVYITVNTMPTNEEIDALPDYLALLQEIGPDALIVTPGVRPAGAEVGDQKRIATPAAAVAAGASKLVIGRPITGAEDPVAAFDAICAELMA